MKQNEVQNQTRDWPSKPSATTRRAFLKAPSVVAASSIALPSMLANVMVAGAAQADASRTVLKPRYYPLKDFKPEIDLNGKLAVITGASRGIGRATAEALMALGAEVIGTSRNPARVPNPPAYLLLELDITQPKSVTRFVDALTREGRKVDILINNAGRFVLGGIIPPATSSLDFYIKQLELADETVYLGHIRVTDALLPLMPTQGYARLLFTVSVTAYLVGGTDPITPWIQGYVSAKRAVLAYANTLRYTFHQASSNILISTVNPYFIATTGAVHPNPIYTEPVLDNGFSNNPPFNQFLEWIRQRQVAGLPASFVGAAYAQLLTASEPPANVVVASTQEPFATQAGTQLIESGVLAENPESALPFSGS